MSASRSSDRLGEGPVHLVPPPADGPEAVPSFPRPLLVLDSFEQVVPPAQRVASLLAGAPTVSLLVTSRFPLRLDGEQEFAVPPLSLSPTVEASDAVRLFVQRARAVRADFALDDANA